MYGKCLLHIANQSLFGSAVDDAVQEAIARAQEEGDSADEESEEEVESEEKEGKEEKEEKEDKEDKEDKEEKEAEEGEEGESDSEGSGEDVSVEDVDPAELAWQVCALLSGTYLGRH